MRFESEFELKKTYRNTLIHSVIMFAGQSLMQLVDMVFCGKLGANAIATVGTSTSLFAWFMVVGNGLVYCLEYLIPHALGEKNDLEAHSYYYSGLMVSILVSALSTAGLCLLAFNSDLIGTNPAIQGNVTTFSTIIALSYLPVFLIPTLRVELQARGRPNESTYAFLIGNVLNIFLNWALIHGHASLPELGLMGSAWANVISRFGIFFYLFAKTLHLRSKISFIPIHWLNVNYKKYGGKILRMGIPSSLHMLFEMGAFILVSTLASSMATTQNAAHSIILSIATFVFMIPLGLGSAAALTLSKLNGEKRHALAIHYGWSTIKLGWLYALISSSFLIIFQKYLFNLYTSDAETTAMGASILLIAAFFQAADATQVIIAGCLRGFGKVKVQAIVNGVGHWLIGLPVGLFFAYRLGWEVRGLWVGLSTGLFFVAATLFFVWKKTTHESNLK